MAYFFGRNYNANQKIWASGWGKKVQLVFYVVIVIYYQFHNRILFVKLKRIIISFISIIDLQIVQCLSHALFEKGTIPHFIWIRWANAANLMDFFEHVLILNKVVKSFLYLLDHMLTRCYCEFKTGITMCIGKTFNSTSKVLYSTSSQYIFEWFVKTSIHWLAFRGTTSWYWPDI